MSSTIHGHDVLGGLGPNHVGVWLRAHGWSVESELSGKFTRYVKQVDGEPWEVEVPHSNALRDYRRRLAEAFAILEQAEERPLPDLVSEVRGTHLDLIRFRLVSESTRQGRIPVEHASSLYQQARDLVLAAACAAVEPRAAYATRKPARATEFMSGLRVAPSEIGSYVLTIESPVAPALQRGSLDEGELDQPFERRATLKLASALQATETAVRKGGVALEIGPFTEAVKAGSSANFCDALATMLQPFEGATLESTIAFAVARPASTPVVRTRFGADAVPVLREAARVLKEREPIPDLEVEGMVVALTSEDSTKGGTVTILGPVEGRLRRVRVELGPSEYQLAVEAHADTRVMSLEGDLQRGRGLELRSPRRVRLEAATRDD
jgi:hypothetical protein